MVKELPGEDAELEEAIALERKVAEESLAKRKGQKKDVEILDEEMAEGAARVEDNRLKELEREMTEKIMPYAATRSELADMEARIDQKMEDLKSLLLRAKAQGKARIQIKEEDKDARLKEIYDGILKF